MSLPVAPRNELLSGTTQIFLAESLLLPTGLISAAFLTRHLGSEGYGLFTLAATFISWVEWGTGSIFSRSTIKFISEAPDWQPVGTTVLQQHLLVGTSTMLLLCLLAVPIANLLNEPDLVFYLLLFSVQVFLFNVSRAHRTILTGLGKYSEQAIATAIRWIARLVLMLVFVKLGGFVSGAIAGSILAIFIELLVNRCSIRPALFHKNKFPVRQLWNYAVPLSLHALSLRVFEKLDLFVLKALGGTAEEAGLYGAAQNLAIMPSIFALSFVPVLLSTLGRSLRQNQLEQAKMIGRAGMRTVLLLLPFAAITAGTSAEIVAFIFSKPFLPAAPILSVLFLGAIAQVMINVATVILTAAGKPNWTIALTAPLLPLALVGHCLVIPQLASLGAAWVTTTTALLGAAMSVLAVYRLWSVTPPLSTLVRSLVASGILYLLTIAIPTMGVLVLVKLVVLALLVPLILLLLGEFSADEMALIRSYLSHLNLCNLFPPRNP